MVATITLVATLDVDEGLETFLALSAILSTITSVVCLVLQCCQWGTSESKMIERELRAATRQAIKLHQEPEAIGRDNMSW